MDKINRDKKQLLEKGYIVEEHLGMPKLGCFAVIKDGGYIRVDGKVKTFDSYEEALRYNTPIEGKVVEYFEYVVGQRYKIKRIYKDDVGLIKYQDPMIVLEVLQNNLIASIGNNRMYLSHQGTYLWMHALHFDIFAE